MSQQNVQIIETKNADGQQIWRIVIFGKQYPMDFIRHDMALSHMGMLRSRGFAEARVA